MCKYCDNHEDYYEGSLLKAKIELGFGGDEYIWVLIDPDTKKLGIVVLNQSTSETIKRIVERQPEIVFEAIGIDVESKKTESVKKGKNRLCENVNRYATIYTPVILLKSWKIGRFTPL